jgi:c-di-GMP-related signal transduction protein
MGQFMVGRQPIFDAALVVHGYELLFRGLEAERPDGDQMTAEVLVHAGLDLGLEALVGGKLAYVNATRPFLVGEAEIPFSPRQVVIEVLEDVPRDPGVLAGCRRLVAAGYTLALDDYVWGEKDDPLLSLARVVKLDVLALSPAQLRAAVRRCSAYGLRLVAEKVETRAQLEECHRLGFDLFQGYLLSRPEVVEGRQLSPSRLSCLAALEKLNDPLTSFGEVENIVQTDAALSYRFLKAAGEGAAHGLFRRMGSVREALVMLGERRLRAWLMLMLLSGAHQGTTERYHIAMTRARMAELMGLEISPLLPDAAFTVGLVSALDLLLEVPLEDVVGGLSLTVEIEGALLSRSGILGGVLADVLTWELGGDAADLRSGLGPGTVERCYLQALAWANEVCGVLDLAP